MQREPQKIQITDADRLAHYGGAYVMLVSCRCGHHREIHRAPVIWKLDSGATIGQLRARLRCAKCQARMPDIEVFRRQRD
jgi:hypothetical protein